MQLRISKYLVFTSLIIIIISGCVNNVIRDDYLIISSVYNKIPKFIPAPPDENGQVDDTKGINHVYAIHQKLINDKLNTEVGNYFYKYSSNKLFEKVKLNKDELNLIKKLYDDYNEGIIDSNFLNKYIHEPAQILNISNIDFDENRDTEYNRILTFSKPLYNESMDLAVFYSINYGGSLDMSQVIYIVKKIGEGWEIVSYKSISKS